MANSASKTSTSQLVLRGCVFSLLTLTSYVNSVKLVSEGQWSNTKYLDLPANFEQHLDSNSRRSVRSPQTGKSPLVIRLLEERDGPEDADATSVDPSYAAPEPGRHNVHLEHSYQQYNIDTGTPGHPEQDEGGQEHEGKEVDAEAKYNYVYEVQGDKEKGDDGDFGHAEMRDGHKTWGRYFVHQPDGRVQTVRYWADDTGYHADVGYHGESNEPAPPMQHR